MPKAPTYSGFNPGDVISLPEGVWYVEGLKYAQAEQSANPFRSEGVYYEAQTDTLVLNLRRVNEEDKDA
mgnify:CR=1 FL=1